MSEPITSIFFLMFFTALLFGPKALNPARWFQPYFNHRERMVENKVELKQLAARERETQ